MSASQRTSFQRAYARYLKGWIRPCIDGAWLDLGCGQGDLLVLAQRYFRFKTVRGIDLSREMIEIARAQNLNVDEADVLFALAAVPDETLTVVSAFDLLEHLSKESGAQLLEMSYKSLQPGGKMILKIPNAYSPFGFGITANDLTHETWYTEATVLQMGKLAGFADGAVKEVAPLIGGPIGSLRWALWKIIRSALIVWDMTETGAKRTNIYTRVMLVCLEKAKK
jgi:SAM-dependent methyltransferase